jgi:FtsH-binding integral membrane protein
MPLCSYFYSKVFAHLAAAFGIATGSAAFSDIGNRISRIPITNIIVMFIIAIISLIVMFKTQPGGIMKYASFIIFAFLMGQFIKPLIKTLEHNRRLVRILSMTVALFIGMMLVGWYDDHNLLGLQWYLFAGLLGLIIVNMIWFFVTSPEESKMLKYAIDVFGVSLFSIYIAYHTQKIKENARMCKTLYNRGIHPDYPVLSVSLFLDVLNLFTSLGNQ